MMVQLVMRYLNLVVHIQLTQNWLSLIFFVPFLFFGFYMNERNKKRDLDDETEAGMMPRENGRQSKMSKNEYPVEFKEFITPDGETHFLFKETFDDIPERYTVPEKEIGQTYLGYHDTMRIFMDMGSYNLNKIKSMLVHMNNVSNMCHGVENERLILFLNDVGNCTLMVILSNVIDMIEHLIEIFDWTFSRDKEYYYFESEFQKFRSYKDVWIKNLNNLKTFMMFLSNEEFNLDQRPFDAEMIDCLQNCIIRLRKIKPAFDNEEFIDWLSKVRGFFV